MDVTAVITFLLALAGGGAAGYFLVRRSTRSTIEEAQNESRKLIDKAKTETKDLLRQAEVEAKELKLKAKTEAEEEVEGRRKDLLRKEERLIKKEESNDKKEDFLTTREVEINRREKRVAEREKTLDSYEKKHSQLIEEEKKAVERAAGLTAEEAKRRLISEIEEEARLDGARRFRALEEKTKEESDRMAKRLIGIAIQRYAGEYVAERTVTVIPLPNDDMKGRIIGREGRNIRALEAATGVDLIIDDTPEAVILSAFDPIRREVARIALERLIVDGRIHPSRIEEIVQKSTAEVEVSIKEAGEQATFDLGLHGIHPEIVKLIGRLRYRTSFAQNVLQHSIEVGFLSGMLAAELGLNVKQARRAGLLHDIGKAVDHEVEGSHAIIGANLARKYGEQPTIVNAIASHHEEEAPTSILARLVEASDALSGARPGARREMLETYVRRLEDLERLSSSFKGVEKSYAIQAGREIRIMVESERVSDDEALLLARDVAKKIEQDLTYPGQIKVTVIRETRAVEYAR